MQSFASESEKHAADQQLRSALNLEILARYPSEFLRYRSSLERWLREKVLHRPPTPAQPSVVWESGNSRSFRVRWLTTDDLISVHRVATDKASPPSQPGGAKVKRGDLNQNGGWPLSLDGPRMFVSIWPVVELDWGDLFGPALTLAISPPKPGAKGPSGGIASQPPRRDIPDPYRRSSNGPSGLTRS
jgi:hypothetical protein